MIPARGIVRVPFPKPSTTAEIPTSIDKALDVCEALSLVPGGIALTELARAVGVPQPSVHRLLDRLMPTGGSGYFALARRSTITRDAKWPA